MDVQPDKIRKAAILVATLDRTAADAILAGLGPREAALIRGAADALESIDPYEQRAVIDEFCQSGRLMPHKEPAGVELDAGLAAKFVQASPDPLPETISTKGGASSSTTQEPPFRFLQQADGVSLVPLLRHEHPQTIAVVLSHLPHEQAGRIVLRLGADVQAEVLRRLSHLDEMDPESLREVERGVQAWMAKHIPNPLAREAGVMAVAGILDTIDGPGKQRLIQNLRANDESLAERLIREEPPRRAAAPRPFSFDEVAELEPAALEKLIRAAEPELVMLALAGADDTLVTRLLSLFPPRDASALRHALQNLGPTRLSDVEAAQREIARLADHLEKNGEIVLRRAHLSMAA